MNGDRSARANVISAIAAAVCASAVVIACFYPGYMSSDSVDQLGQARSGIYTATHPPLMAWVWHWTDLAVPGPLGMIVLQNALFFAGVATLAVLAFRSAWSGAAVLAVAFVPPVFALLGTAWKDVQMGSAFVAAFALLCLSRVSGRRIFAGLALLPLCYGFAVRPNAPAAALPLAVLSAACMVPLDRWREGAAVFVGVAITVAMLVVTSAVNGAIARGRGATPGGPQGVFLHDLVGISAVAHANFLPDYLGRGPQAVTLERLLPLYTPLTGDPIAYTPGAHIFVARNSEELGDLRRHWIAAVRRHPRTYLRHRWMLMRTLLGLEAEVWQPFHLGIDANALGVRLSHSAANRLATRVLLALRNSLFFRGWIYLLVLLAAAVAVALRGLRAHWAAATLAASGILYAAPYFFFAPAPDFRYLWWSILCAVLLPFALGMERVHRQAA